MYGIFTYIWVIYGVNVGKYSIHGSYGYNHQPTGCLDTSQLDIWVHPYLPLQKPTTVLSINQTVIVHDLQLGCMSFGKLETIGNMTQNPAEISICTYHTHRDTHTHAHRHTHLHTHTHTHTHIYIYINYIHKSVCVCVYMNCVRV